MVQQGCLPSLPPSLVGKSWIYSNWSVAPGERGGRLDHRGGGVNSYEKGVVGESFRILNRKKEKRKKDLHSPFAAAAAYDGLEVCMLVSM